MTPTADLVPQLAAIVGRRHLLTGAASTRRYAHGYRFGHGPVAAVARPGSLVELWRILQACCAADAIVIMQAANTGLTGGSTPFGTYDRPVVLVSTTRLTTIHLVAGGQQALCLPGATLDALERKLAPLGREPHSVIGSSCLGASVVGGICNNSGGALVQRGPAYTELALYARRDAGGALHLVNRLGVALPDEPEAMLAALEQGRFDAPPDIAPDARASADDYADRVRRVDDAAPARYNADPSYLRDAAGSAGHVVVFAVRTDTFAKPVKTQVFYVGTNDPDALTRIRREVLATFTALPISAEYLHRGAFDLAAAYGKDMFLAIRRLGTTRLPLINAWKDRADRLARRLPLLPANLADRVLHGLARLLPAHLPPRLRAYRDRFEHHLLIRTGDEGSAEMAAYLDAWQADAAGDYFACTPREGEDAFLHRFVAAGAAVRYRALHPGASAGLVSLDIALPRNARDWLEALPPAIAPRIGAAIYYGHFFCHVFHQDYIAAADCDLDTLEEELLAFQAARGAKYPAEHGVGHLYHAEPTLEHHFRALDPTNSFNPGVGHLPRGRDWIVDG